MDKKTVYVTCPFCGDTTKVVVDADGYREWENGELVQVALPNLSADDREVLISGICPPCWDKQFPAVTGCVYCGSTTNEIHVDGVCGECYAEENGKNCG